MELERLIAFFIGLGLSLGLAFIAWRGLANGSIKPFRMGRWRDPDEVQREDSPSEFWQWVVSYLALSAGAFVMSVLALLGKMKLR